MSLNSLKLQYLKDDNFKVHSIIPSTYHQLTSTDLNRCDLHSAINQIRKQTLVLENTLSYSPLLHPLQQ